MIETWHIRKSEMIVGLKTGGWLTPERLRHYPVVLLILFGLGIAGVLASAHGNLDYWGRPLGTDFSQVWTAGQAALDGQPGQAYDIAAHRQKQSELFGLSDGVYLWSYPPYFLGLAALLALLPYLAALALWQGATLLLYLKTCSLCLERLQLSIRTRLLAALAFPAVFVNLIHGQNGFLTAGLLAGGLMTLTRRPVLAGVLFGCLAYKPQFAILVPVALLAGGSWRSIIAALLTLCLLTIAANFAFGLEVWPQFLAGINFAKISVLDQGGAGFEKMQSLFAAARLCGASAGPAYFVQGTGLFLLIGFIAWAWHSTADLRLKGAALLAATLLATPYSFDYDLVLLGPALALSFSYAAENGFRPFEKSFAALLWLSPVLARPIATLTSVPLECLMIVAFLAMTLHRLRSDTSAAKLNWHTAVPGSFINISSVWNFSPVARLRERP